MPSILTPPGMGMFVHLFVPKPVVAGGEPRFNIILLFDKEAQETPAYKALKKGVAEAIDAKFGAGKSRDQAFIAKLRMPFRDAAEKKQYSGFMPGMTFINPWTKERPGIVDGKLHDIITASDVWAGQMMRATVTPFAYDQGANKGASFMLNNVQIVKSDMPRMDGRKNANQDFDPVEGDAAAVPNDDADIPF